MSVAVASLLALVAGNSSAQFVSMRYTAQDGETALHRLTIGVNLADAYRADVATVQTILNGAEPGTVEYQAASEILDSLTASLTQGFGNNPEYKLRDVYTHLDGFTNVSVNRETGAISILAVSRGKRVIAPAPAPRKAVKSAPKTIAKNAIRARLISGKIRRFNLTADQLGECKMRGHTICFR